VRTSPNTPYTLNFINPAWFNLLRVFRFLPLCSNTTPMLITFPAWTSVSCTRFVQVNSMDILRAKILTIVKLWFLREKTIESSWHIYVKNTNALGFKNMPVLDRRNMQSTVDTPTLNTGKRVFFRRNQLFTSLAFLSLSNVSKFHIHTVVFWVNRPILPNFHRS
jgi:hypothetical protein